MYDFLTRSTGGQEDKLLIDKIRILATVLEELKDLGNEDHMHNKIKE